MKPLVKPVEYLSHCPLYKLEKGKGKSKQVEYAWTDDELENFRRN